MSSDPSNSTPVPIAEISQGPSAFEQFLDKNQKNLIAAAITVAVGVCAWVVYSGVKQGAETSAGNDLMAANDLASLQKVIADHSGSKASVSAMLLLADKQWAEGQQPAAIETLEKLIAANPNHAATETAIASLAAKFMATGKTAEANTQLNKIINGDSDSMKPFAYLSLGDLAAASGDNKTAKDYYERISTLFPTSGFVTTATTRISDLNTKAPTEIAPPPAPAPQTTPTSGSLSDLQTPATTPAAPSSPPTNDQQ